MKELIDKFKSKQAKVGVIGLGYVGLSLAIEFAKAGFCVTGIEKKQEKVRSINNGKSPIIDVTDHDLSRFLQSGKFKAVADYSPVSELDSVSICVPTPLRKSKDPDMSFIVDATKQIKKFIKQNQLIVLESTTYPGTTNELVMPLLEKSGLKAGKDFYLAFSPERVDPGNKTFTTRNIPKVIGGITKHCTELATCLYEQIMDTIVPVSSTRVAETVKLLENTFRSVNIGLVNEMALMCHKLGINVWEVIDAASTKPFGFMPFYPGPGLGGHCIPIDPFYLSWKARMSGFEARFIDLADQVNNTMPHFVVDKIADSLNRIKKSINGSRIHILGVAYKKNINDIREAPSLDIMSNLTSKGGNITYSDPCIPEINYDNLKLKSLPLTKELLKTVDCSVIITNHDDFDYKLIVKSSKIIVDTRNALKDFDEGHIVRL